MADKLYRMAETLYFDDEHYERSSRKEALAESYEKSLIFVVRMGTLVIVKHRDELTEDEREECEYLIGDLQYVIMSAKNHMPLVFTDNPFDIVIERELWKKYD